MQVETSRCSDATVTLLRGYGNNDICRYERCTHERDENGPQNDTHKLHQNGEPVVSRAYSGFCPIGSLEHEYVRFPLNDKVRIATHDLHRPAVT